MGVRMAKVLGVVVVVLATVMVGVSRGGSSVGPDGTWPGCEGVALPSAVQVRQTVQFPPSGFRPLSVTQRHTAMVRRWFRDVCVIMGHPYHPPSGSVWNCPADFGLTYVGVFYAGNTRVAVLTYGASGCEGFTLSAGADQASTMFMGPGADPASRFDDDLAAVLGVHPGAINGPFIAGRAAASGAGR